MAKCELCGRELQGLAYRIRLEGAELIVCPACARGKTIVGTINFSRTQLPRQIKTAPKPKKPVEVEQTIVENYGDIIRNAREKMGLTRDMLAAMVGEKESIIRRIEAGQLEPTIELARKLEKVLKIKLVEEIIDYEMESGDLKNYDITLGDIAEFKD